MYAGGKREQITKNGAKYEQTLYKRIEFLIDIRMPSEFSVLERAFTQNDIKDIKDAKAYSVEFVYDKPQTIIIYNGNKAQIEFTNIYFPLGNEFENMAVIITKDNKYTLVGLKENLDYLVKATVK